MADLHGNEPVEFDNGTADALKTALTGAANAIEGQAASRQSYVDTALQDFEGHFSDLFRSNGTTAASDAGKIVSALRDVAGWVQTMKESAARENARRKTARDWYQQQEDRNLIEKGIDFFTGGDQPPTVHHEDPPSFPSSSPSTAPRQTPTPGGSGGGGGGGTSSARPEDLRSFATGSSGLNGNLSGKPSAISGKLADFHANCKWGTIDAAGLVSAFSRWLTANDQDVTWANTVADAFAAAGGEGNVSTVSDAALATALAAAGVSASRSELTIDPPTAYGAQPTTGYSMDPVNTTTGNFLEPETDLAFTGAATTLRCTRMYNSLDQRVGVFGPGWSSVLETRLLLDDDGASYVGPDGRLIRFPRQGDGWDRGVGEDRWLRLEGDELVVSDNDGGRSTFTRSGLWTGSSSGPGTGVRVERDASDAVVRLVHERGRSFEIDHVEGRVAVLRSSDGRRVEYGYDDLGRLVTVTDAVGTRTYGWDDDLVVTVTSAAGVLEVENRYDDQRRVVEQRTPHGRTVRFAYLPGRVTVVSDQDGTRSNSYVADAKGRLVGVLDADDQRQSMAYDAHGNLVSVTERDGSVTVHAYDERGRKVRTVTPAGGDVTYGYDDQDRVTTVVTEAGAVVAYEYVGADRDPSVVVDPVGGRTEMVWADGLLQRVTGPTGVTVTFEHDAFGDLIATTNAVGDVARVERDAAGRPVASISPSGARTEYAIDDAGLLVERRDADGGVWRFEHTTGGRIAAVTDPLGGRTTYAYGPDGELAATTDPLGRTTARSIDDQGNLAALTLPDGASWSFEHDAISRLRATTDPTGAVWRREYDVNGELRAVIDPTGVTVELEDDTASGVARLRDAFETTTVRTDEFGRPVEVSSGDGDAELITYDAAGRPVELVDADGGLTLLERDLAGHVVAVTTPTGARSTYEYDACGRPSVATDALGGVSVLTYDADSRVVERRGPDGQSERFAYDPLGRLVERTVPGAGTARYTWDAAGRLTEAVDGTVGRRRFRYDAAGQLREVVDARGGVTRYEYDARGRVVRTVDPLGGERVQTYDAADRVTSVTDALGRTTTMAYDAAGRLVRRTDPDGHTITWSHDAAGRQHRIAADGVLLSETAYDARDRSVVVTDHTRGAGHAVEHEYRFDSRGNLVRRARGDRAVRWEYDADGRRTARTDADGVRTVFRRDALGRVVAVERADLPTGTFGYDVAGRIVEARTGQVVQRWSYVDGSLVAHVIETPDGTESTTVDRDGAGRVAAITRPDGRVEYRYDEASQLVAAVDTAGSSRDWAFDEGGRIVTETVDGVTTSYEYDVAGQLLAAIDPDGSRTEYVHDGLGRRVRRVTPDGSTRDYAWSALGYLTSVADQDPAFRETGRIELWTDALGELAVVGGAEVLWDSASTIPGIVSLAGNPVLDVPGGVVAAGDQWAAGNWRAARATAPADPWAVLGVTAQIGGALGLPAGVELTASGGILIAGLEWSDARVYDPVAHGFLSTDPLAPVTGAGWAANPYSYAGNDPLHMLDPLGLKPATDADLQAYKDAHANLFTDPGKWWDGHWEYVAAAGAIVVGVALAATGVGGPAGIALMVASGALISGGVDLATQKAENGTVDWGQVGVQALIGGAGGLVGGAAAAGLAKAAPMAARAATPWIQNAGSRFLTETGQAAIASGLSGSTTNMMDYGIKEGGNANPLGYVGAGLTGFGTGAGGSYLSSHATSAALAHIDIEPRFPVPSGRHAWTPDHAVAPNVAFVNGAVKTTIDHGISGVTAGVNEAIRPGGEDPWVAMRNGFLNGAEGPTAIPGQHVAP